MNEKLLNTKEAVKNSGATFGVEMMMMMIMMIMLMMQMTHLLSKRNLNHGQMKEI